MNTVNEPGLYSFVLGSRKPEAREFKRWITHEVIPAIIDFAKGLEIQILLIYHNSGNSFQGGKRWQKYLK